MFQFAKKSLLKNNRLIYVFVSFLLIIAIFVSAVQPSFTAKASTTVAPRYQAAIPSDSAYACYTSKNVFHQYGYGMPNCTCYAYGRAYELLGKEPNLCVYDADQWYDYNIKHGYYPYGQTPKIGAIACWSYGESGHVAVVEAIVGDKIIMSQSAYGYLNFYLSLEDYDNPGNDGWKFQGYIYPGEFTSSGFNGDLYRVAYSNGINFRSGAGTNYDVIDVINYHEGFVVTDTVYNGGYTWGKTTYMGKSGYVALTNSVQFLCAKGTNINPDYSEPTTEPTTKPETKPTEPPTQQANDFYIITSEDGVNMRNGAGTSYSKIGGIPYNAQIHVTKTAEADNYLWGYTTYKGASGWCVLDFAEKLFCKINSTANLPYVASNSGILGDVDGDGFVNIIDATYAQMYISGYMRFSQGSIDCADINKDGDVSISDSTEIQMYVIKLTSW